LVRPRSVHDMVPVVVQVRDPGLASTAYPVIDRPPLWSGADHFTVSNWFPGVADTLVGAPGTVTDASAGDATVSRVTAGTSAPAMQRAIPRLRLNDLRIPLPFVRSIDTKGNTHSADETAGRSREAPTLHRYHQRVTALNGKESPSAPSRLRVLLAIKSLGYGGAERLVADLVAIGNKRARERSGPVDYEVAYLLAGHDALAPFIEAGGTPVHCLGAGGNLDFKWMPAFRRLLLAGHYDIVHFHLPYTAALGRLVVLTIPRDRRPATIYTEHSLWNKVAVLVKKLNRATVHHDSALVAVSQAAYDHLPRRLQPRARVVVHGVDLDRSRSLIARRNGIRAAVRAELDVPPGELLVLAIANLRSEKGYDVLLDTAALLIEQGLPIRFAAAGQGAQLGELTARHRELGLGDRFRFLGHREDALELLVAADV
jgi:Glycosyltransferase Family 4/Glycosyl transferases group 1